MLEHENRKPAASSRDVLESRRFAGLASPCFNSSGFLDRRRQSGASLHSACGASFYQKRVVTVLPLNPSVVLFSTLSSSGSGASQTLLLLHRFYGVTERLNFAPLSAALSNYRFCRDTPPSKQPLCLIICDRKRMEKGTLVKLIWILSSSSEINSLPF